MQTLNQDLKEKKFRRVYLLFGDEPFLTGSYKKRFREAITEGDTMNYNYFEGKAPDIKEIISLADTMPFFAERRLLLIDGSGFFKSASEELFNYLPSLPETTCMIFCETEVDKRSRLYKRVKELGYAAELKKQSPAELSKWALGLLARDGKKITKQLMEYFLDRTGDDMENIRSELEKLVCYTMGRDTITKEDVEAVGSVHVTNRIFELVSAAVSGNLKKAMDLYEDLLTLKEPPMRILFLIARQFNQLLQVKELNAAGSDKTGIAARLKVPPFAAGRLLSQAKAFSREQLLGYVKLCVELEEAVKTGHLADRLAVELLITSSLQKTEGVKV
ncbi:MAG: DNA polymerase III subunit delta [Lachnospiraceae bacterium]|nr:DNA polymerase III subunit delta [Lachnospiraceae bacterium]